MLEQLNSMNKLPASLLQYVKADPWGFVSNPAKEISILIIFYTFRLGKKAELGILYVKGTFSSTCCLPGP